MFKIFWQMRNLVMLQICSILKTHNNYYTFQYSTKIPYIIIPYGVQGGTAQRYLIEYRGVQHKDTLYIPYRVQGGTAQRYLIYTLWSTGGYSTKIHYRVQGGTAQR